MKMTTVDEHFRQFAHSVELGIRHVGATDRNGHQLASVNALLDLEDRFKIAILKSKHKIDVYSAFIDHIRLNRHNILDARPFFRERKETFSDQISDAFKQERPEILFRYRINYRFVTFVMGLGLFGPTSRVAILAKKIEALRQELAVVLLPLCINRARVFYRKTPKAHLAHMDMVQNAFEGLLCGMDKYCPEEGQPIDMIVFRSTVIGRISGNLISDYNQTAIHFYPLERRKLYRARKAAVRAVAGGMDSAQIAAIVNEDLGADNTELHTTASEIAELMAASSPVSADSAPIQDPEAIGLLERYAAPEEGRPDVLVEEKGVMASLAIAFAQLTPYEQKFMRLRGIRL
jgi:DNA-directed RNA polymerase specialized sigma subunit